MDKDKEIIERIKRSKERLDERDQRAILVKKNPIFRKEFNEIVRELGKDFLYKYYYEFGEPGAKDDKWRSFQERWGVDIKWSEDHNFEIKGNRPVDAYFKGTPNAISSGYINISISGRARLEDIREIWPAIQEMQKELIDEKGRKKTEFSRDLCWYELNKDFSLSSREILEYWIKVYPDDFDLTIINAMLKDELFLRKVKDLKKFKGKKIDEYFYKDILEHIRNEKQSEIKDVFEEEKNIYLTGRIGNRRVTPKAQAVINSGIKRLEKNINKVGVKKKIPWLEKGLLRKRRVSLFYKDWNK